MSEWGDGSLPTPLQVVLRFEVAAAEGVSFAQEMTEIVDLLGAIPGCESVDLGRSTDDPTLWLLVSMWTSVGAYRRAISSYEVKMRQPMLSRAIDEPSAFEVLYARRGDIVSEARTARSAETAAADLDAN